MTGLLVVEMLKGAWAFVRQNWQAIALTAVVLGAGYAGWRGRGEWDAGKLERAEAARMKVENSLAAETARAAAAMASNTEKDVRIRADAETIAGLRRDVEQRNADVLASGERTKALAAQLEAAEAELRRRDAEREARPAAPPYPQDCREALDEMLRRLLALSERRTP